MTANFARRVMWWSLLINTPAGVSYSAKDVANWTTTKGHDAEQPWREALALPGARAIAPMAFFFDPIDFWSLKPFAGDVLGVSGGSSLRDYIAACKSEAGNLTLIYVPEERVVKVLASAWPASTEVKWFNPRTGQSRPAVPTVASSAVREFTTPSAGDWVLLVNASR